MLNQRFLEATSQSVAWFWKKVGQSELELSPPFQRNPVWQDHQKAYLIDTILRGYPIPELYLQFNTDDEGNESVIVVDGQQRIRACVEFISGKFALEGEGIGQEYVGQKFDQLSSDEKKAIFGYKFVVRTLPALRQEEIRDIFGRLNRNNVVLNKQELRQATYWGDFITCVVEIAKRPFWVTSGLFTSNDIRRMLDIEYVSELVVGVLYGPQNKKGSLDKFYAAFEEEFPDRNRVEFIFDRVLDELSTIVEWPSKLRWSRKVDFYSLFIVLANEVDSLPLDRARRGALIEQLQDFSAAVTTVLRASEPLPSEMAKKANISLAYTYARGVRNSSDLGSRRIRIAALGRYLGLAEVQDLEELIEGSGVAGGLDERLPTMEKLYESIPDDDSDDGDS